MRSCAVAGSILLAIWTFSLISIGCRKAVPTGIATAPDDKPIDASVSSPRLLIVDPSRDLGNLSIGTHSVSFEIVNTGSAKLKIDRLETSCSCVNAALGKSLLLPSENTNLTMEIHPRGSEVRTATIKVHSNDPASPQSLTVNWKAQGMIDISPDVIDFGAIRPGSEGSRLITVTRSVSGMSCRIVSHVTPKDSVSFELKKAAKIAGDVEQWEVRVKASDLPGQYRGRIHFSFEECDHHSFAVPILWRSEHPISVLPTSLFLGTFEMGEAIAGEIRVNAPDGQALDVQDLRWKSNALQLAAEFASDSQTSGRAVLKGVAPTQGAHRDVLQIRFNVPSDTVVEVPVVFIVRSTED